MTTSALLALEESLLDGKETGFTAAGQGLCLAVPAFFRSDFGMELATLSPT
jgi:hypothetical protein